VWFAARLFGAEVVGGDEIAEAARAQKVERPLPRFEDYPVAQFYDIVADNNVPFYHVYGGTQDNNSLGGPARTRNSSGIMNSDWDATNGVRNNRFTRL